MTRKEQLQNRIDSLNAIIKAERVGDNCQTYIDDCLLSIKQCQTKLNNIQRNPALDKNYQMVN